MDQSPDLSVTEGGSVDEAAEGVAKPRGRRRFTFEAEDMVSVCSPIELSALYTEITYMAAMLIFANAMKSTLMHAFSDVRDDNAAAAIAASELKTKKNKDTSIRMELYADHGVGSRYCASVRMYSMATQLLDVIMHDDMSLGPNLTLKDSGKDAIGKMLRILRKFSSKSEFDYLFGDLDDTSSNVLCTLTHGVRTISQCMDTCMKATIGRVPGLTEIEYSSCILHATGQGLSCYINMIVDLMRIECNRLRKFMDATPCGVDASFVMYGVDNGARLHIPNRIISPAALYALAHKTRVEPFERITQTSAQLFSRFISYGWRRSIIYLAYNRAKDNPTADAARIADAAGFTLETPPERFCFSCGRYDRQDDAKISQCAGCKLAWYCSVGCQSANRKRHKNFCRAVVAEAAVAEMDAVE